MGLDFLVQLALALLGAYLAAFWLALAIWTYRDIRLRTRDPFVQVFSALLTLVFGPAGLLVYLLLRPPETLAEAFQRSLAEEALLRELEDQEACPTCKRRLEKDFLLCPDCQTQIRKLCLHCGRALNLKWKVCPYCAAEQ